MKAKRIIGKVLIAFVLVSIGVAIGKEMARNQRLAQAETAGPVVAVDGQKVVVYYMHASFRCVTCNLVESMGEELVRTEFADAVKAGKIQWKAVNYQEDDALADHYKVGGNMIIVARFQGGKEIESRRLDRVMELANNRSEFMPYVRAAIKELLESRS